MKVVINTCYGGFSLSKEAFEYLNLKWNGGYINNKLLNISSDDSDEYRTSESLIKVVEELGERANGDYAELEIIEIPDNIQWYISDDDGIEEVHEEHRSWS